MNLSEITKAVQAIAPSTTTAQVEAFLESSELTPELIDSTMIPALVKSLESSIAPNSSTSTQLTEVRSRTNSSVKKTALANKEDGAIAKSKRGSSRVAKSTQVEKAQIEKASTKTLIKDIEVSAIEDAANAGYNADTGKLAAIAFVTGVQMRATDDIAMMLPKAMSGIFGSIGEVSDTRYQGIFDHVRINEPDKEVAIDWSF